MTHSSPLALVTGATAGLGAAYAEELAARGYDLVLVARNKQRLDQAASDLTERTGRSVSVLSADLGTVEGVRSVEGELRDNARIELLVNNAGSALFGPLASADADALERLVTLNVTSFTRVAVAAATAFAARGNGAIVNVSSAMALNYMPISAVYSATKSYVLAFTQGLAGEFADSPVRIQAVLPGGLRTTMWDGSGLEIDQLPPSMIMSARDAAKAGLAGLDAGETITIPSLPDYEAWRRFEQARQELLPDLSLSSPAARYAA